MSGDVNLYDGHYGRLDADPLVAVRRATYDEDLGQASWITLAEARDSFAALGLGPERAALEVACGSGGITCRMALETSSTCVGIDLHGVAVESASRRARDLGLADRVRFQVADAASRLPFADGSFDAVFCNDSINHLGDRPTVLRDWHRVLRPGGRVLYTDPIVVTGPLTGDEMRARSSIGPFVFTPLGVNEAMLEACAFRVDRVEDRTEAVASVSWRWREARRERRTALVALEGEAAFEGLQGFLDTVHRLAAERRLSRYLYLASKRDEREA